MARVTIPIVRVFDLPPVCVCCGEPATRTRRQEFRLDGVRSAAVLVASAALGALAWTERGLTLELPVCERHRRRGRRGNRTFFRGMGLTAVLGVAAYVASYIDGMVGNYVAVAAMFAFIVTLVVAMHEADDGLKVRSFTPDSITLAGVDPRFAQAVERLAVSSAAEAG
jgi:hypothetical protein